MWPPSTVWNSTHPQVHVHSLRLSPARICSVCKISVWPISVQFSQKKLEKPKRWNFDFSIPVWIFEVTFSVKKCIFSTNFHFLPNLTQKNSIFNCCTVHCPEKSGKFPTRQHPVIRTEKLIFPYFFNSISGQNPTHYFGNSVWCQKSEAEGVKSFRREVMGLGKKLVRKIQIQVDREFTTLVKIRTV